MKKIAVIYGNRENQDIINYLNDTLSKVFEGYARAENYYCDELGYNDIIQADAYLVSHEKMIYELKGNIPNHTKVVFLKRSLKKNILKEIMEIPVGSEVYVVNDSYDTEIETIYMFCELGFNDFVWKPYSSAAINKDTDLSSAYIITPGEPGLAPKNAKAVLDVGYREVGFDTLFSLMRKLDLDNDVINRNIIKYSYDLIEPNSSYHDNYYENCLKGKLLNMVVDESISPVVVLDRTLSIVYFNENAKSTFKLNKSTDFTLLPASMITSSDDFKGYPMKLNGDNYMIDKSTVKLIDETIGYIITFQNEKTMRDIEAKIRKSAEKKGLIAKYKFNNIVYESSSMKSCISLAMKAAETNNTILLYGESGTGKELIAQSIHNFSKRRLGPFVAVNCSAIPESLIESELFGYEKGSFTGAQKDGKIGYFEQAQGGTLFLDEIGNISPNFQKILLRVIQERQVIRIGGSQVIDIDVRIVAATNANLVNAVKENRFRDDLYYRLNVIPIRIEPLKFRKDDILPLFSEFMGKDYHQISPHEKKLLLQYDWPGNVRQLKNAATYYKTLGKFPDYLTDHFSDFANGCALDSADVSADSSPMSINPTLAELEGLVLKIIKAETELFHGIGRSGIQVALEGKGIRISDGKLRDLLGELQDAGLVVIKRGRGGTSITEKGISRLAELR